MSSSDAPHFRLELADATPMYVGPLPSSPPESMGRALVVVLVNTTRAPVQAFEPIRELPKLTRADGTRVELPDVRRQMTPLPQFPPPPARLIEPGSERRVAEFGISSAADGVRLGTPFGGAVLAPGPYVVTFEWELRPMPRASWEGLCAFASRRLSGFDAAAAEAWARESSARYEEYWRVEGSCWWGPVRSEPTRVDLG